MACLTKFDSSQVEGCCSDGSSYPEFETAYFKRVYGSDHLKQLHDDHQVKAIQRYVLPQKRTEVNRIINQLSHLSCENEPLMKAPGRSAYSLKLLAENLQNYQRTQARSLRWNQHYQLAIDSVASEVRSVLNGRDLEPMSLGDVAASESIQRNLDKNAGYYAFETGRRSKGENLAEAIEWCSANKEDILARGRYALPLVMSHRSSNSKPTGSKTWKWRCRVILMQDLRAVLMDGRFAIPFITSFQRVPWGEGGMTSPEIRTWVQLAREHYSNWYSSDYSKFDTSQPAWLLEDVFEKVIRPLFGHLSTEDEALFQVMVESYIHKDVDTFLGRIHIDGCQVSGSLMTYAINTVVNQIVDRTALLMQGCDYHNFTSLKCGDDNLTYYSVHEPWDRVKHAQLILKYFGIKTTLDETDCGSARKDDPHFLSRVWTRAGERRSINEVLWNLIYPERRRNYSPAFTGVAVKRAAALVLYCACLEQDATMRDYFDVGQIRIDANIRRTDEVGVYHVLANMGSGFRTPWINFTIDVSVGGGGTKSRGLKSSA